MFNSVGKCYSIAIKSPICNAAPLCLMRNIWKERKNHTFNGVEKSSIEIKYVFLRSLQRMDKWTTFFFVGGGGGRGVGGNLVIL